MNQMKQEGLIKVIGADEDKTETFLENDSAFMHYDYSQTQTLNNETYLSDGEEYTPVMVPVAMWNDGTGAKAMRFTESWRSVKTDGWGLSKAGIGNDTNKLNAALKLTASVLRSRCVYQARCSRQHGYVRFQRRTMARNCG